MVNFSNNLRLLKLMIRSKENGYQHTHMSCFGTAKLNSQSIGFLYLPCCGWGCRGVQAPAGAYKPPQGRTSPPLQTNFV